MPTIKTSDGTAIYYRDWGSEPPIVFSHGWPRESACKARFLLHFYHAIIKRAPCPYRKTNLCRTRKLLDIPERRVDVAAPVCTHRP
jgi:pimeloyl-ACP methyl ester carboxylesterase